MALLDINWNPNQRELRQFSLLWIVFFGLIGVYCLWAKGAPTAAAAFWVVATAGPVGYFRPAWARPIYVLWMALTMPVGWVISHLVLLVVYYLVVTPIGLIMRLVGYDPMQRTLDRSADSYWTEHESSEGADRYFKQY
jgi:hypothetical protein